jgi:hypothetical protein
MDFWMLGSAIQRIIVTLHLSARPVHTTSVVNKQATHQVVLKVLWISVSIISPMLHPLTEQTHQLPQQQHTKYQSSNTSQSFIYHPDWYHQVTGSCSTKDTLSPHSNKNKNTTQFQLKLHLHRQVGTYLPMKVEQTVFRNVGIQNSDAGELPRRKHTTM